jgi:hypothetical protein
MFGSIDNPFFIISITFCPRSPSYGHDSCLLYPVWAFPFLSSFCRFTRFISRRRRSVFSGRKGWLPRWIRRFEVHSRQILPSTKRNWPGKPPYDSSFGQPETASVKIPKRFRQQTNRTEGKTKQKMDE